jgi:diguanylate cyclase (GGDEF)-like protein
MEHVNSSRQQSSLPAATSTGLSRETGSILLEARKQILLRTQLLEQINERLIQRNRDLEETNSRLQWLNQELERLATTDDLTGLRNRRVIEAIAQAEVDRHARYGNPLALGIVDVDQFKDVNREYLLPGGDQVLIGLARALAGAVRTTDRIGRIGGDEFMVVACESDIEGVAVLAERICATVEATPIEYGGKQIAVTVSIGFAVTSAASRARYDELRHTTADALAEAKATGRNRCVIRSL